MFDFTLALLAAVRVFFRTRSDAALEVLALRQQVAVLKRKRPRPRLNSLDRLFWTTLRRAWSRRAEVLIFVKPETVVGWPRAGAENSESRPNTAAASPAAGAPGDGRPIGLAESHLTRRLFGSMVRRIGLLPMPAG